MSVTSRLLDEPSAHRINLRPHETPAPHERIVPVAPGAEVGEEGANWA